MDAEQLTALEPEKYDHLIILSQDTEDHDADKVDSDHLNHSVVVTKYDERKLLSKNTYSGA